MLFYVLYLVHALYILFIILYNVITIINNKVIVNEVRLRDVSKRVVYGMYWLPLLELQ